MLIRVCAATHEGFALEDEGGCAPGRERLRCSETCETSTDDDDVIPGRAHPADPRARNDCTIPFASTMHFRPLETLMRSRMTS